MDIDFTWVLIGLLILAGIGAYIGSRTSKRKSGVEAYLPGPDMYAFDIVGESHYQDALEKICGGKTEEGHEKIVKATIVLEDNNPHDSNAVRVDVNGMTVGHFSREGAVSYRRELKKAGFPGITATCSAMIVGGWDRGGGDTGNFGVKLDLPTKD